MGSQAVRRETRTLNGLTFQRPRSWDEGFRDGGPGPRGPSPAWPSFCVLFGWSHLPPPARTQCLLSWWTPGHAPAMPRHRWVSASAKGGSRKEPAARCGFAQQALGGELQPHLRAPEWLGHPSITHLGISIGPRGRKAVAGNTYFVCFC